MLVEENLTKVKEQGGLESAYEQVLSKEPEYTTWKVKPDDADDVNETLAIIRCLCVVRLE